MLMFLNSTMQGVLIVKINVRRLGVVFDDHFKLVDQVVKRSSFHFCYLDKAKPFGRTEPTKHQHSVLPGSTFGIEPTV